MNIISLNKIVVFPEIGPFVINGDSLQLKKLFEQLQINGDSLQLKRLFK